MRNCRIPGCRFKLLVHSVFQTCFTIKSVTALGSFFQFVVGLDIVFFHRLRIWMGLI